MKNAQHITLALKGFWHGSYGVCLCPAHANTRTPALSLSDTPDGRLLAYCHAGCDFKSVLDALRGLGLVEGRGTYSPPNAADLALIRAAEEAQAAKQETRARNVWNETQPIHGTVAEAYLRDRAITCDLPNALRFHPDCWHPTGKRYPAMVALILGSRRLSIHRTFLRTDGTGKADVTPQKAMLGAVAGGAVCVAQGQGPLVVAEGIETALSLASGLLRAPATVWAALSTSGIRGLHLPPHAGRLTIAADGDNPGRAAAQALAERAHALGWQVALLPAPEGTDWNDFLQQRSEKANAA